MHSTLTKSENIGTVFNKPKSVWLLGWTEGILVRTSSEKHASQWRHNGRDSVSNHQPHDCLLNCLFIRRWKKTSKLRITGLCVGNSPVNSPHKWPVTRKMFPFDDVIMDCSRVRLHGIQIPIEWNMHTDSCALVFIRGYTLQWRHNGHDSVSNHLPHECLLNLLFRRRSKKTSKLRVTGHCAGNSPGTGEFPAQMASNAENVSIWWRHHVMGACQFTYPYSQRLLHRLWANVSLSQCRFIHCSLETPHGDRQLGQHWLR